MPKILVPTLAVFLFLGIIVWQRVESTRKAYMLREYAAGMERARAANERLFLRLKDLKSSQRMMRYAADRGYKFPSASEVVLVEE